MNVRYIHATSLVHACGVCSWSCWCCVGEPVLQPAPFGAGSCCTYCASAGTRQSRSFALTARSTSTPGGCGGLRAPTLRLPTLPLPSCHTISLGHLPRWAHYTLGCSTSWAPGAGTGNGRPVASASSRGSFGRRVQSDQVYVYFGRVVLRSRPLLRRATSMTTLGASPPTYYRSGEPTLLGLLQGPPL